MNSSNLTQLLSAPRLLRPCRDQELTVRRIDDLLPPDHEARAVWDFVAQLDLAPWYRRVKAVEGHPGRAAIDARILLALWVYATLQGVGSARQLDDLCQEHHAFQWLRGGVGVNYHTLADFRSD